jgi:hypothetical protein
MKYKSLYFYRLALPGFYQKIGIREFTMIKKLAFVVALTAVMAAPAMAATEFVNGGFESGDTMGWTTGTGARYTTSNTDLKPSDLLPGGALNISGLQHSVVVGKGVMEHTDGLLNQVYSGNYSFRAEDMNTGGYASAITQRVNNYTGDNIYFSWAATLEGAHGADDAGTFKLVLRDETLGTDVVTRSYNAASDGTGVDSRFALTKDGSFFYTKSWQVETLPVSAGALGHDFSLTLLAADCELTAHQGTVYLDGFGAVNPVPEPQTYAMMLAGLMGVGFVARCRKGYGRNKV